MTPTNERTEPIVTREEHDAIQVLSDKVEALTRSVDTHIATCKACSVKVDEHDTTLYKGDGKTLSLVRSVQSLSEWRERSQFIERGVFGGFLSEAGKLMAMAIIVGAMMVVQAKFAASDRKANAETIERHITGQ